MAGQPRQAEVFQGTAAAGFGGPHFGGVMPLGKLVHFRGALTDQFPQRRREGDWGAPPGFPVIQGTLCHFAAEHLFQTHGLCTQLHFVGLMFLGPAAFILHGEDTPPSGFPVEGN